MDKCDRRDLHGVLLCLVNMLSFCEVCSSEPSKYRCPTCELMRYGLPSQGTALHAAQLTAVFVIAARLHVPSPTRYTVPRRLLQQTKRRASHRPTSMSIRMAPTKTEMQGMLEKRLIHPLQPRSLHHPKSKNFSITTPSFAASCMIFINPRKRRNGSSGTTHPVGDVHMAEEENRPPAAVEGHGQRRRGSIVDSVESES